MRLRRLHQWDLSPREAVALQRKLAPRVRLGSPRRNKIRLVAGADVSVKERGGRGTARRASELVAGVVVLALPGLETVEETVARAPASFPYVPGLLSFREAPVLLAAFAKLKTMPDAVLFDGQGIAHPRLFGIASHVGLFLDLPTVGVAKSILVGEHGRLRERRGARTAMRFKGRTVGAAVRTRDGVKPVYVSPGHLLDLGGAVGLVLDCGGGYRLPEPTRRAHLLVTRERG